MTSKPSALGPQPSASSPQPTAKALFEKPAELYDGLRLHQNENTLGCSPRVIEFLEALPKTATGKLQRKVLRG